MEMSKLKFRTNKKILREVFHILGADKLIAIYFIFFILMAIIIWIVEPNIKTLLDSIWFCFATASTAGYGDVTAVTTIGRILSIILSIFSVAVIAIFTAVITSYYMEQAKLRAKESARKFIDDLQHLDELSKEELRELSEKVKRFDKSI